MVVSAPGFSFVLVNLDLEAKKLANVEIPKKKKKFQQKAVPSNKITRERQLNRIICRQ